MQSQEVQMEERLRQMPETMRKTYLTAMHGRSLKAAAASMCWECVGYDRGKVKLCTDSGCPLYPYRPLRGFVDAGLRTSPTRRKSSGRDGPGLF